MEFNEKLFQLRTRKGLTQEQLAEELFVSRVTVSKWESGRGYPNIDSLKLIANVFSVSVDEMLSSDELIIITENQTPNSLKNIRSIIFGILDCMPVLLFVLPCCGNDLGNRVAHVNLLDFNAPYYILLVSYILIFSSIIFGVLELALQNIRNSTWLLFNKILSSLLPILLVLYFIMIRQPYGTTFLFFLLLLKVILLLKQK